MTDRKELKRTAKERIRAVRPRAAVVALIFLLVLSAIIFLDFRITAGRMDWRAMEQKSEELSARVESWEDIQTYYGELNQWMMENQTELNGPGKFLTMALEILAVIWLAGFPLYSLRVYRQEKADQGSLFDGFAIFFKIYFLDFLQRFLLGLAFMLLVIPGIVLSYALRQSRFVLFDHPEWPVGRCMLESARLMRGNKWKLFVLDLSFLGWGLLSLFPPVLLYTLPLINVTTAGFYDSLVHIGENEYVAPTDGEKPPWEY